MWEHLTATPEELVRLGDGRILALGTLQGLGRGSSIQLEEEAAWICTLREGKLLRWESYGTRDEARRAAGLA